MKNDTNLLIVEDLPFIRDLYRCYLWYLRVSILEAMDGEQGLELAKAYSPKVIIVGNEMTLMDGFTFLKKFRETANYSPSLIIFTASEMRPALAEKAIELGANLCLNKNECARKISEIMFNLLRQS